MSFAQTLMHYKLGHHPMGGVLPQPHQFPSHLLFQDHLVSRHLGDEGNNTPFFSFRCSVKTCTYFTCSRSLLGSGGRMCGFILRARLFDKGYHGRAPAAAVAWFRRKQNCLRSSPAREQQFRSDSFLG
jgi:hypothetical protein